MGNVRGKIRWEDQPDGRGAVARIGNVAIATIALAVEIDEVRRWAWTTVVAPKSGHVRKHTRARSGFSPTLDMAKAKARRSLNNLMHERA